VKGKMMKVSEWIYHFPGHIITIPSEFSLLQSVDRMLEAGVQDIYVISSKNLVLGHLSHKRLASLFLAEHKLIHTRRQIMERVMAGSAEELMESEFVFALPDEELDDVLCRFVEHHVQDIPVLDNQGLLIGGIHLNTVLREIRKSPDVILVDDL
jgi:predicted transcriptional regulator